MVDRGWGMQQEEGLGVMPGLGDDKLAGHKGCIAFVQSPKVCVVAIASGYNA